MDYGPIIVRSICAVPLLFVVHRKVNSPETFNITIIAPVGSQPHDKKKGSKTGTLVDIDLFVFRSGL